jgi:peptidylprolyl isomerase
VRLFRLVLPVLALATLTAGCGSGGSGDTSSSPTSTGLGAVHVAGAAEGQVPKVTVDAPLSVKSTTRKVLSAGNGEAVDTGKLVTIAFVGVNGTTGKQFGAGGWSDSPASFVLGDSVIPGFTTALKGVKSGSEVLTAVTPKDGYGSQGLPSAKIGAKDTIVYLIKVDAVGAARAQGTPVTPPAGLPTVALDAASGKPTVTIPQGVPAPTQLVSQDLVKGTGPAVTSGQVVTFQYTGVNYRTGQEFDSSWSKGSPFSTPIGTGQVIKGWDTGLVGKTVGSQVLLVVPPDQGYGPQGGQESAGISATDTLVFVVDILAAG